MAGLIEPLKLRFAGTPPEARSVRVALLGAMAAIGAPEFKPEFEANLSAEDTELLLRAIRGAAIVGNGAQLDRLSNLTTHPDARVRQRALDALGALGGEEQLSTVTARMSPGVETVEGPRRAAWDAFKQITARLPIAGQVAAADRLADLGPQRMDYLKRLHDRLAQTSPPPAELDAVREQAARAYAAAGRNAEALPYWRALQASAQASKSSRLIEITLAVLECALACDKTEQVEALLDTVAQGSEAERTRAATLITAYLDRLRTADRMAEYNAIIARLAEAEPNAYPALAAYLQQHAPADKVSPTADGADAS